MEHVLSLRLALTYCLGTLYESTSPAVAAKMDLMLASCPAFPV